MTILGLEKSGRFLIESGQSPVHRVNDALGNTSASRCRGDAADHRNLLNGLVGGGRRANDGRFGINQFCCADGLNRHGARLGISVEDELDLCPLENGVHDILRPLGAENDSSATSKPDSMGSSDIINLESIQLEISKTCDRTESLEN